MQGEVHIGKTITDLSELVERAEAKAGCYALSGSEPSADDPVVEETVVEDAIAEETIGEDPSVEHPIAEDTMVEEFQRWERGPQTAPLLRGPGWEDSCGAEAAAGKASDGACVEGLGERHGSPCEQGKDGEQSAMSSRSESQQNCAGLGAEWGIPPAGIQFGAAADGAPFVAPSFAPYPGPSAAPKLLGRGMEALILAQSCLLLSRALAYVGLADLHCARALGSGFPVELPIA